MQTFLPYPDFAESARVLDRARLGKQRVETLQVARALTGLTRGWRSHPAVRMWRGHEAALLSYQRAICREWTGRGYKDTCLEKTETVLAAVAASPGGSGESLRLRPFWLGDEAFHRSHQSNLIRKDPAHYGPLFPGVPADLEYVWPR